jgi:hypothetical protein
MAKCPRCHSGNTDKKIVTFALILCSFCPLYLCKPAPVYGSNAVVTTATSQDIYDIKGPRRIPWSPRDPDPKRSYVDARVTGYLVTLDHQGLPDVRMWFRTRDGKEHLARLELPLLIDGAPYRCSKDALAAVPHAKEYGVCQSVPQSIVGRTVSLATWRYPKNRPPLIISAIWLK